DKEGKRIFDQIEDQVIEELAGRDFLFALNNDRKDDKRLVAAGGTRIKPISHGLNEYQDYTNVFYGAALNYEPKHIGMLLDLGFSRDRIQHHSKEAAYQCVMRTALRKLDSNVAVRAIVPDIPTAEYLAEKIGAHKIGQIGNLRYPKPAKPLTPAQKTQRLRVQKNNEGLLSPICIPDTLIDDIGIHFGNTKGGS